MKSLNTLVFCALGLCMVACTSNQEKKQSMSQTASKAKALLTPTKGNKAVGQVDFTVVEGGVLIVADFDGLSPGKHGFHIHEFGDCSAPDASSAGGHFNPMKQKHGAPNDKERHVGDMGNLEADADGHAHYERIDTVIKLSGESNVIGRAVIVHEKEDDFSQPVGNAGTRLACGVIVASE